MELDWKLKGSNLLKFNCNKESIVHPETCTKMVQMDHDSNKSLYDWITNNDTTDLKSCLGDWIDTSIIEVIYTPTYQSLDDSNSMLFGTINSTPVRIPFGTTSDASTPLFGVFKAGNGFSVTNGILNLGVATNNAIGGIKTGYHSSDLNKAVELDQQQRAFVNLNGVSVNSTIASWYGATEFSSENPPKTYHVQSHANWTNYEVSGEFNTLFNKADPTGSNRIYPICQDTEGKMFTFVPWSNTTYELFDATRAGIVPSTANVTNKSTKFLNAVGDWIAVPYSSLTGTPSVLSNQSHASNTNYLVKGSGYSTTPTKYLKEDGTWSVPTGTTYSGDGDTIILNNTVFTAIHQYNTLNSDNSLGTDDIHAYKKIVVDTVGIQGSDTISDIVKVIEGIITSIDDPYNVDYSFECNDDVKVMIDDGNYPDFIKAFNNDVLHIACYGDIVAQKDNPTTKIAFTFEASGNTVHYTVSFKYFEKTLTIVSRKSNYVDYTSF